ncbi:hypothetical protein [Olivibacter sitiensis]|nr:hypothetical protein [Olivibacter sitiensis]
MRATSRVSKVKITYMDQEGKVLGEAEAKSLMQKQNNSIEVK